MRLVGMNGGRPAVDVGNVGCEWTGCVNVGLRRRDEMAGLDTDGVGRRSAPSRALPAMTDAVLARLHILRFRIFLE